MDLNLIVEGATELINTRHPLKTLQLSTEQLPTVTGSKYLLSKLFQLLLENSLKFSRDPQVAEVSIAASRIYKNTYLMLKDKYQYSDYWRVSVHDNGKGIEPEFREVIFDITYKGHQGDGRGFGLALARRIVRNLGGEISARGDVDQGATFDIFLPVPPA